MKLKYRKRTNQKQVSRINKKQRIRKTVRGTEERPRLCVYRSLNHIYAQIIDDVDGKTLVASSSVNMEKASGLGQSKGVGMDIAKKAIEKNIKNVVFDRNGYIFHGRVKALADSAREAGLNF